MSNYLTSNPAILNEARDYIDGLMLGDGHIHCSSKTGYYTQSCKYKNWLDVISEYLYEYSFECNVSNEKHQKTNHCPEGSVRSILQTCSYIEFKEMHDRWYKPWYDIDKHSKYYWHKDSDGEYFVWQKIIPKDIRLTQECVANWYLGDGHINKNYRSSSVITFATDGFLREDTIFLANLLSELLDINCAVIKRGVIEVCSIYKVCVVLNYIKDYKVDCYSKKFPEELINL